MWLRKRYHHEMTVSPNDDSTKNEGRKNQKARTRTALLQAAVELLREGKSPSMPQAADRAMVSIATAYRYFPSADTLWWEASTEAVQFQPLLSDALARAEVAGADPQARLEAIIRVVMFHMLDDQVPYRRIAKTSLEQWFEQLDAGESDRPPVREGRRNELIVKALAPLDGKLTQNELDRVAQVLGLVVGTEAMIALTDGVGLDARSAKIALVDAGRWLLAGALAELVQKDPRPSGSGRHR